MTTRFDGIVKSGRGLLFHGLLLGLLVLGVSPTTVRAEYEPSSTDPPDWYTKTMSDGMIVNGVGTDTASGFVNALGALTRRLDPSVQRMSEEMESESREKLTRVLAETSFDSVHVSSMSEYYTYRTGSSYSGRSDLRRIVRVEFSFDAGDTEASGSDTDTTVQCEYRSYLEEIQSEIGTSFTSTPDQCDWDLLEKTMAREGIAIVRGAPGLVRHYVQIRYQDGPVKIDDKPNTKSASRKSLGERSLNENKKAMEREMDKNLEELRGSDTDAQNDTSTGSNDG